MRSGHGGYRRRAVRPVRLVLGALVLGGMVLAAGAPAQAQTRGVTISGFVFQPTSLLVQVGDTVAWQNADSAAHTATANGGKWDTRTIAGGTTSVAILMDTPGTFPYHCSIHPGMTGTIVVAAAATPTPTPAPTPPPPPPSATPAPPTAAPPTPAAPTTAPPAITASPPPTPSPSASPAASAALPSPLAAASGPATFVPTAAPRSAAPQRTPPPIPAGPGPLLAGIGVAAAVLLAGLGWLLIRRR